MNLIGQLRSIHSEFSTVLNKLEADFGAVGQRVTTYNRGNRRSSRASTRTSNNNVTQIPSGQTRARHLTAAARRKMSLAAKARWANRTQTKKAA